MLASSLLDGPKVVVDYISSEGPIAIIDIRPSKVPIVVLDYGSSEGYNSMIYFRKVFDTFRKKSDRPITIIHTDLPNNNWSAMLNILNTSEHSYLRLNDIYYSTVGTSFFSQLVPSNSVHVGFSGFAFHYLSKRPDKKRSDNNFWHKGISEQAVIDMTTILNHRINELVVDGTLTIVVTANSIYDKNVGTLFFFPFLNLLKKGVITQEEIDRLEWTNYGMHMSE